MLMINPYLNFSGTTEEAFNFYRSIFGGEFSSLVRFKDTPQADNFPEYAREQIMHIALPISEGSYLMATDAIPEMGHHLTPGNNQHISIINSDIEEATRLFNGLSEGGKIAVPFKKEFWGDHFGMFIDKFGVSWMVSCSSKEQ